MDDKRQSAKQVLQRLRSELQYHDIGYEQIAHASIQAGLNRNRGYKQQKIKNVLTGRVPVLIDIVELCLELIEQATTEQERLLAGDLGPVGTRLERLAIRREQLAAHYPAPETAQA